MYCIFNLVKIKRWKKPKGNGVAADQVYLSKSFNYLHILLWTNLYFIVIVGSR